MALTLGGCRLSEGGREDAHAAFTGRASSTAGQHSRAGTAVGIGTESEPDASERASVNRDAVTVDLSRETSRGDAQSEYPYRHGQPTELLNRDGSPDSWSNERIL